VSSDGCGQALAQLEHIALATNDIERTRDFYLHLGAIALPLTTDPDNGSRNCVLDFCGVRLEFFERSGSPDGSSEERRSPGLRHLGFALASADAVDELSGVIAAAGHRVLESPRRVGERGRYESVLLDPDGNHIKLAV
jgi:lactoylglutathione lyase